MHKSSTAWRDTTFPATVKLASSIYDYGNNKAPVYYRPILPLAERLDANPDDAVAKSKLKGILDVLEKQARDLSKEAEETRKQVAAFADASQADYNTLVVNNEGGLYTRYEKKYGSQSDEVVRLTKEIADQRVILQQANAEYDHNVVVASTTPTYAWIIPQGLIAAVIVAGVFGDRATKALQRSRAAQAKIDSLTDTRQASANLMTSLQLANASILNISSNLKVALPIIQRIQGVWGAMADDLGSIIKLIDINIRKALPVVMDLGVESAIKSWGAVAQAADTYRKNAFVQVPPAASMEAWRVNRMLDLGLQDISVEQAILAVA
jgi:hypothetical protein